MRDAHHPARGPEHGATAVEYAIAASMIAAVIIVAVVFLGGRTNDNFECYNDSVQQQSQSC